MAQTKSAINDPVPVLPVKRLRYSAGILSDDEILELLQDRVYRVDCDSGRIQGQDGRTLVSFAGNEEGHRFVRLYYRGKRKTIAVQRLVWLAGIGQPLPPKYEVHHINMDVEDNRFENLIALHPIDHRKVHRQGYINDGEETPF